MLLLVKIWLYGLKGLTRMAVFRLKRLFSAANTSKKKADFDPGPSPTANMDLP